MKAFILQPFQNLNKSDRKRDRKGLCSETIRPLFFDCLMNISYKKLASVGGTKINIKSVLHLRKNGVEETIGPCPCPRWGHPWRLNTFVTRLDLTYVMKNVTKTSL